MSYWWIPYDRLCKLVHELLNIRFYAWLTKDQDDRNIHESLAYQIVKRLFILFYFL